MKRIPYTPAELVRIDGPLYTEEESEAMRVTGHRHPWANVNKAYQEMRRAVEKAATQPVGERVDPETEACCRTMLQMLEHVRKLARQDMDALWKRNGWDMKERQARRDRGEKVP